MARHRGTPRPLLADEDLPVPVSEPKMRPFEPEPRHWEAVDVFMDTQSLKRMADVLGTTVKAARSLTRRTWFKEQIRQRGFVPVDPEDLGRAIAVEAGSRALDMLQDEDTQLSPDALKKFGDLGVKLAGINRQSGTTVNIGTMQQLDLRGMSPEEMRDLLGGSAADAADDVIDTDFVSR